MNKIFRVVLNRKLGVWQVVSELARGQGKSASDGRRRRGGATRLALKASLLALGWGAAVAAAHAAIETDGGVSPGVADISAWTTAVLVGDTQEGTIRVTEGTSLINQGFIAGMDSKGNVFIDGAGTVWSTTAIATVGQSADGALTLSNGGNLTTYLGTATVSVANTQNVIGTINFGAAAGQTAVQAGNLLADRIVFGPGTGVLNFNHTGTLSLQADLLSSGGTDQRIDQLSGRTQLLGASSGFAGNVTVTGGTLAIMNSLGSGASTISSLGGTNPIVEVSGINTVWSNTGNLVLQGDGSSQLSISGGAKVLSEFSTLTAATGSSTVAISGPSSSWTTRQALTVGQTSGVASVEVSATVSDGGLLAATDSYIGTGTGGWGSVLVSDQNSAWNSSGFVRIGDVYGNGTVLIRNGATGSSAGTTMVGSLGGTGSLTVTGAGSHWTGMGTISVGGFFNGNGTLTIADGGVVTAGSNGTGTLKLVDGLAGNAALIIGSAAGQAAVGAGTLEAAVVEFGMGPATLTFNHTNAGLVFSSQLVSNSGSSVLHGIQQLAGTTLLTGDNSGFGGFTTVSGGTLVVKGLLGGTALVNNGGALQFGDSTGGSANTMANSLTVTGAGSTLSVQGPATVTISSSLTLENDTVLNLNARAGSAPLSATLAKLGAGVTLNLSGISDNSQLPSVLIDTSLGILGDFANVNVGGYSGLVDYMTVNSGKSADGMRYLATYGLSWTANNNLGHGTFTLTDAADTFDVGAVLADQMPNPATNWDGATLTKAGDGTLTLSAVNAYSGGTRLQGGRLSVSQDANLGAATGALAFAGGTLATTASFTTARDVSIAGPAPAILSVAADTTLGMSGQISGGGDLYKDDAGTLLLGGNNTFTGDLVIRGGTVAVSSADAMGRGGVRLFGGTLSASENINSTLRLQVDQDSSINVDSGKTLSMSGAVSGANRLTKLGTGLLQLTSTSSLFGGEFVVQAGTVQAAAASLGSKLSNNASVIFDQTGSGIYVGNITGTGSLGKQGIGVLAFYGQTAQDWSIEAGMLFASAQNISGNLDVSTGSLMMFAQQVAGNYGGAISGSGGLAVTGSGLTLSGDNSAFSGHTSVLAGSLTVDHTLGGSVVLGAPGQTDAATLTLKGTVTGDVEVAGGGVLQGSGQVNGKVDLSAGVLQGQQGQTLRVDNSLTLDADSKVNVALGAAGGPALFDVGGNLVLGGTLNVSNLGGFSQGVYRLFDYQGSLSGSLAVGSASSGIDLSRLSIQTSVANQVNLFNSSGITLGYWDGADASKYDNGVIDGGTGTWSVSGRGWTNNNGATNGAFSTPTFANFGGQAGVVTVDTSAGAITVTGMRFGVDGYRIEGDDLVLQGDASIGIGDGTSASSAPTATLVSALTGSGKLRKIDYGTLVLQGNNSYSGGTEVMTGVLSISSDGNLGAAAGGLTLSGGTLMTTADMASARAITLAVDSTIKVQDGTQLDWSGAITGSGRMLTKSGDGTLVLSGLNDYGSTRIAAGTLVGSTGSIRGNVLNQGSLVLEQTWDDSFGGTIIGGTSRKTGGGILTLTALSATNWSIDAGRLISQAEIFSSNADIGSQGWLQFNQSVNADFGGKLSGTGRFVKEGSGRLGITADSSLFNGTTEVNGGLLDVSGKLGGKVSVAAGGLLVNGTVGGDVTIGSNATLGGRGTISGNVALTGGVLSGVQGRTLRIGGNLSLDSSSQINVALGGAPAASLFTVGGDLALAGTLNISDQGGFGAGVYNLFNYSGQLLGNTLAFGSTPTGIAAGDLRLQTAVDKQINLISTAGATLSFWDGDTPAHRDNGIIDGGSGVWSANDLNWTRDDGRINGSLQPRPSFAVFQGASGTVTVDRSQGAVGVTGMQFLTDGYRIEGDTVDLQGPGGNTTIRVGNGNSTGAGIVASIAANLAGSSGLVKSDLGTLVLSGANSYVGDTSLASGVLSVSADNNLGDAGNKLVFDGGSLRSTSSLQSQRNLVLNQAAILDVASNTTLDLQGAITGPSGLEKLGSGTLVLGGVNSYAYTRVQAGTLVGSAASLAGHIENNSTLVFDQAANAGFAGNVSGTGQSIKRGSGDLTLSGVSTQAWRIEAGRIVASADALREQVQIDAGATLNFVQTTNAGYGYALSGAGTISKTGAGSLALAADNSGFSGVTRVEAGTLYVGGKLGGSASVSGGLLYLDSQLSGNASISGNGVLAGAGTVQGNADFTGGVLQGEQGQTLRVAGTLTLDSTSQINVALGSLPGNALFTVGSDLTLAGTLNVEDQGGFSYGIYRLFEYGGTLTNQGLAIGGTPAGVNASQLSLQTSVAGQVNLASTAGAELSFWDGDNTALHDNGSVNGGTGVWQAGGRNWTNLDGSLNGSYQPNPTFAIFLGQAGTVTVDASAGAIGVTGMQFGSGGYLVQGDSIALQGAGGESLVRVGAGSANDAGMTATIDSTLTGQSKLVKADYGVLILNGDNSYSGGTEVRGGTLAIAKDSNLGAAGSDLTLNGGVLRTTADISTARKLAMASAGGIEVADNTTLNLAGLISGNGDLSKAGLGTLTVSGNASGYTGQTNVLAGLLNVTGAMAGKVAVASGATLQGTGSVGSTTVQSGGILAPGDFNTRLTVNGDLTLSSGAIYQVNADPDSNASSRVDVTGTARLAGSVVHIGAQGGYEVSRQYTILHAGALDGQFDSVSSNFAYLDSKLSYTDRDVNLTLGRKQSSPGTTMRFADAARSGNQRAVANAIESLKAGHGLYEFILTLPDGAPAATFDSLTGETHASVASSLMNASSTPRTLPFSYLRANLGAGMNPGAPTAQAGGSPSAASLPSSRAQPAWAEVIGNWQTMQGNGNSAQVRQHTGGIFVGADHEVGSGWRLGAALGYTDGKIKVDDRASQADVSSYSAALYGGKAFDLGSGKLNLLVGTSYTWHDIDTKRYATVASGRQELTASYGASTAQLFGELGYAMAMSDRSQIEPFVGVAWSDMRTRSFSEHGGIAALSGKSNSDSQTSTTLGLRGHYDFTAGSSNGRLKAMVGWRHAFGDVLPQSTMSFDGGQAFTVAGSPIARNAALAELGAEVDVARNTTLGLSYSGQYGGGNREHAGSLNLRWKF